MRFIFFIFFYFFAIPSFAQLKNYDNTFDIDLSENIPALWKLEREYKNSNSDYDWRYDLSWNMPTAFDTDFKKDITYFGSIEKRLQNADEESIYQDLKRMPKDFYPYIGPMLHSVRGLSGKILDMPGIKETKNQFPTRIASKVQNIPNLRFVSPELYLYLMPELWGEGIFNREKPQKRQHLEKTVRVKINPEFIERIKNNVSIDDYSRFSQGKKQNIGIRHYNADKNTPLSQADVVAFISTLNRLDDFRKQNDYEFRFMMLDNLLQYWDEKNGIPRDIAFLRTIVNPCQTVARKIKWSNKRTEFQQVIGNEGFGIDDWAYTCDKTIKAYRVTSSTLSDIGMIRLFKKGFAYQQLRYMNFTAQERKQQKDFIEATIRLYETTPENIDAVQPVTEKLKKELRKIGTHYLGTPIILP